jgi:branched-chain amino acid transport system substrate-binding protein
MKKFSVVVLAIVLTLGLTVASGESAEKPGIIRIGISAPFSGPAAGWGIAPALAIEFLAAEKNAAGGVVIGGKTYKFEVVREDNGFTIDGAKTATTKLSDFYKVDFVFGGICTDDTLGTQMVTTANHIINMSTAFHRETLYKDGKVIPYAFHVMATQLETIPAMWKYVQAAYPKLTKVAIIAPSALSSFYGSDLCETWLKPTPLKVVSRQHYEYGAQTFKPFIQKAMAAGAEIIQSTDAPGGDWGLMIKEARQEGYKGLFFQEIPIGGEWFFDICGRDNANGLITFDLMWYGANRSAEYERINNALAKKKGWSSFGLHGAIYFATLVEALQKAGTVTDDDAITKVLETTTFNVMDLKVVFGGKDRYGANRQLGQPLNIVEVKNGEPTIVGNISVEDQFVPWPK